MTKMEKRIENIDFEIERAEEEVVKTQGLVRQFLEGLSRRYSEEDLDGFCFLANRISQAGVNLIQLGTELKSLKEKKAMFEELDKEFDV